MEAPSHNAESTRSIEKAAYIPITVFTGFLGAGKTSVILSLLPQLPKDHKVVLLKNEFGDIEVDSKLAQQSSLTAVSEFMNGCMCCVLSGQVRNALIEIRDSYRPDRIIIECSGSAFPATLAVQINELERETSGDFKLDAIVTVIDAENFTGYEDTSPTAKMQSSYTDVILINKWEHISERQLDTVLDHLHTLNDLTPKLRCRGRDGVDPKLIFGVESNLSKDMDGYKDSTHNDEVETVTIFRGSDASLPRRHTHPHPQDGECDCPKESLQGAVETNPTDSEDAIDEEVFTKALEGLSKESIWRVKGFVRLKSPSGARQTHILNWAFGRFDLVKLESGSSDDAAVKLTAMGERGEVKRSLRRFIAAIDARIL